jgi:hypothetical protein
MEQITSSEFYLESYSESHLKFSRTGHVIHDLTDENGKHEIFNVKHNSLTTTTKLTQVQQYTKRPISVWQSIPTTGLWYPEGSGFPDSVTSALEGGRLSLLSTGRLYSVLRG